MNRTRLFYSEDKKRFKQVIVSVCLFALLLSDVATIFTLITPIPAEGAEVTITSVESTTAARHLHSGSQSVFISDQEGYKFFAEFISAGNSECSYVKTEDGGDTWGVAQKVDDQGTGTDCLGITVHYDKWTPGDTGDYIHILTMDNGSDDLFYNRLDTTDDSLLAGATAINVTQTAGYPTVTFVDSDNKSSITKSTTGELFISVDEGTLNGSRVYRCSTACDTPSNWSEAGTSPQDDVNDWSLLTPLLAGEVLLINWDLSANTLRSRVWHTSSSSWSTSWTTITNIAEENTTYDVGMSAVTDKNGVVYLAHTADNTTIGGNNDDVRTKRYDGSWATTTNVVTNTSRGVTQVALGLDSNTNDVYVAYTARTTAATASTTRVYWHKSTDGMSTWGSEQGPVNTPSGDLYGIDLNRISNERIYASWYSLTGSHIRGDTLADVYGGVAVSATSTQVTEVRASSTNVYSGGTFVLQENSIVRTINSITVSENGSIDASTGIRNTKLVYDLDTSAPYNCVSESYGGSELQYGDTDTNGFSASDGVSAFSDIGITISSTSAMCLYVVHDVTSEAVDGDTINFYIDDPSTDVEISVGGVVVPSTIIDIFGTTTVKDDVLTQSHYHFRNDDGSETTATSKTGGSEDTELTALQQNSPVRLRIEVSNEGSTTSLPTSLRLEYSLSTSTCSVATGWTDVGATNDAINMSNTGNLTDGSNTTDIPNGDGGVSNENTTFLSSNGGVRDTSSQTGPLTFASTTFVELEYSIVASTSAPEGSAYCFRLTDAGTPLGNYVEYPRVTIDSAVRLSALGSQIANTVIPGTAVYIGGAFVLEENVLSRDVTSITIKESGSIDATTGLTNTSLYYETDTSLPYDCSSESYAGGETAFSSAGTFTGADGTATFTDTVNFSTSSTLCLYVVTDITESAVNGETLDISITNPSTDVLVSGGATVSPGALVDITGSTTLNGAILTQTHFHFRNDDGNETTATSKTGGVEDIVLTDFPREVPTRVRVQVSNEGSASSAPVAYQLEYGTKITTCENIGTWLSMDSVNAAFEVVDSSNLTDDTDTTDITVGTGGVTNENTTFLTPNSSVEEGSALSATTTLSDTEFIELEYVFQQTDKAGYNTSYCFRLSKSGVPLNAYDKYPELTTTTKKDFKVQRGSTTVTGTSVTITAGVDYVAPSSTSSAFIRITNSNHTGAGRVSGGGNQFARDVSTYISNPRNLLTSVTFVRPTGAINNTRVDWEIVEYVGDVGGDNEMIVRDQYIVDYGTTATATSGPAVSGVVSNNDVVVFITGAFSPDASQNDYETLQSTSNWATTTQQPTFTRGVAGGDAVRLSYAVVEFTGVNWKVQRIQHTYTAVGSLETKDITPVNSLSRAFIHTQKQMTNGLQSMANFGHEVWLSSIGVLSFRLDGAATTASGHTSVAWVIENTQLTLGAMKVHRDASGSTSGGVEPLNLSLAIGATLAATTTSSIFANSRLSSNGANFPQPIAGFSIASTTNILLWRSDSGNVLTFRVEVVEWPVAELSFRQNYYQFYVDNGSSTPEDIWPPGPTDLDENAAVTGAYEPIGEGEQIRIRMTLKVANATFPDNNQSFKLQYGRRTTPSCTAISSWSDVGNVGSGAVWRGYNTAAIDGSTLPSTLISIADVAGTFEEENNSAVNPNTVLETEDIEYDWAIEHNGALQRSDYCFRMVYADGTPLSVYSEYPTLRTTGYTPVISKWRWYTDESSATPLIPLAGENVSPIDVVNSEVLKLRVTLREVESATGENVKFAVQYSQYANFSDGGTFITSTTTCTSSSTWCYADVAGIDNELIDEAILSDAESCASATGTGCGTYNEIASSTSLLTQDALSTLEFEYAIRQGIPRVGGTYYFRLYDTVNNEPISASSSTFPSLITEGALLSFSVNGLPSGTTTEGIVTDATTTPTSLSFGYLPFDDVQYGAHRLSVSTNATEGYRLFVVADQQLTDLYGNTILPISGTNTAPVSWATGCSVLANSCFGYHAGDDVLEGGSARFAPNDTFSSINTSLGEIMYSTVPASDTHDIVYGISVSERAPAGAYQNNISYIAVPVY